MHPDFFLFGWDIKAYVVFTLLAAVIVLWGTYSLAVRRGLPKRPVICALLCMTVAAFVGARLLYVATDLGPYLTEPWRIFSFDLSGFSLYGGLMCAVLAGMASAKIFKFDVWKLGDAAAPFLGLGIAAMRVGCFLNGCCFGTVTSLPWGVTFPLFSPAHLYQMSQGISGPFSVAPVHPTELYELAAALMGSLIAVRVLKKKRFHGAAILAFTLWFTAFRFFNNFLRMPSASFHAPAYFYPLLYIFVLAISVYIYFRKSKPTSV